MILTATASGWTTVELVSQLGHLPPGPQTASEVAWVPSVLFLVVLKNLSVPRGLLLPPATLNP